MNFLSVIFGNQNKKTLKRFTPLVPKIEALEPIMQALSDEALQAKTNEFKERLKKGETLDDILVEAFAVVREASKRVLKMRHFDVQMIGGAAIHSGMVAEMRTGEGKTLVATLPSYLNALEGKGVHVVTVNDYLAKRDAVWMAPLYDFLGMSVGIIQNLRVSYVYDPDYGQQTTDDGQISSETLDSSLSTVVSTEDQFLRPCSRKEAYACDITYGTNNEFGFDYLRDNMVQEFSEMVMRQGSEMNFAIIDEADSILIDEARTPLIISAPAEEATEQYYQFAKLVKQLVLDTDYNVDEKMRSVTLTENGIAKLEQALGVENIYVESGLGTVHHIEQALKSEVLFRRDRDYIVDGEEVVIIDEFTGRKMPGRRYSDGLHQAIEAKELVPIKRESRTLATITFQNLFRMYNKVAGMTGTAETEKEELYKIYALDTLVIPTNRPDQRTDHPDRIYKNTKGKYNAIAEKIKECQSKKQPMLIGTASVEKNEELSAYLTQRGIVHEILNAKNHEREAEIVAQAGRPGAVTLATNMAGRGVDIKLGGSPIDENEAKIVREAGGLFVLGTERHEARRIDNQLRGRAARQGDPGETQFFVSTDDDLMRIFAGDRMRNLMEKLNVPDDMPIEQKMITKMIETAQKKVEGHNFDIRKHLLEYDDVLNKQRTAIYRRRKQILELAEANKDNILKTTTDVHTDNVVVDDIVTPSGEILESTEVVSHSSLKEVILSLFEQEIEYIVSFHTNPSTATIENVDAEKDWNIDEIIETVKTIVPLSDETISKLREYGQHNQTKVGDVEAREKIVSLLLETIKEQYSSLEESVEGASRALGALEENDIKTRATTAIEKSMLLRAIDAQWVNHLISIDYLRKSIGLHGYAQRDPLIEYKRETYHLFHTLEANIQKDVVYSLFKVSAGLKIAPTIMSTAGAMLSGAQKTSDKQPVSVSADNSSQGVGKIGRNEECPCGSGKKYKKCHGA